MRCACNVCVWFVYGLCVVCVKYVQRSCVFVCVCEVWGVCEVCV